MKKNKKFNLFKDLQIILKLFILTHKKNNFFSLCKILLSLFQGWI